MGACAVGRVEREVAGRELVVAGAAHGAGEVLAEREHLGNGVGLLLLRRAGHPPTGPSRHELDLGHALGQSQRRFQRVGQPALEARTADEAVDDHGNRVVLVAGQLDRLVQLLDLAIDAGACVALLREVGEQLGVLALSAADDRCEHLEAGAFGELEHTVDDLLRRLALDRRAVLRAVRDADAGVEQPEVVVDLGDRADG